MPKYSLTVFERKFSTDHRKPDRRVKVGELRVESRAALTRLENAIARASDEAENGTAYDVEPAAVFYTPRAVLRVPLYDLNDFISAVVTAGQDFASDRDR